MHGVRIAENNTPLIIVYGDADAGSRGFNMYRPTHCAVVIKDGRGRAVVNDLETVGRQRVVVKVSAAVIALSPNAENGAMGFI